MDEPFGALDEQTRRLLQEELLRIWEQTRTTVIFITHSMEEAVLLGDRVAIMRRRPGMIEDIVSVPLERPRSRDVDRVERSPDFIAITSHLWERLRSMQSDGGELVSGSPPTPDLSPSPRGEKKAGE
jgi:ABC-type nitrate/sulfonate/bicarbonate transport system ATPase subunit